MKRMKKLFALLMTLAMVMGLGITGFAATSVKVTVDNEYDSFYYLQIVEPDTTSTSGWKYVTEYEDDFEGITVDNLVTIANAEDPDNKYAIAGDINDTSAYENSELAEKLEEFRDDIVKEGTPVDMGLEGTYGSFTAEKGGLYVILPVKENYTYSPTLVYVPVNSDTPITVKAKGASDQVDKEIVNVTGGKLESEDGTIIDGDDSVTANDTVEYKVTMEYPYFSDAADDTTFEIKDTVANGTFLNDLSITVNGSEFNDYNIKEVTGNVTSINGLSEITIQFNNYNPTLAGTNVEITYSVKVNSDVSDTNKLSNTVESTIGTNKTQHIVISDTVKVTFNKVDVTNKETKLPGAVFALYQGTTDKAEEATLVAIVADVAEGTDVTLPTEYANDSALLTKDGNSNGEITFNGLDANKSYYIKEIIAPDGYKVTDTLYPLVSGGAETTVESGPTDDVNGVATKTTEYKYKDFTVNVDNTIPNTTLSALPSTGGMGTTLFTIAGCVIMISAAGLFFATRKKAN